MNVIKNLVCCAVGVSLIGGCSTTSKPKDTDPKVRIGTAVKMLPRCPSDLSRWTDANADVEVAPIVGTVLATLVPVIAEKSVEYGAKYLKDRKDALSASSSGRFTEEFYAQSGASYTPKFGCIVFVRSAFGSRETLDSTVHSNPEWPKHRLELLRGDTLASSRKIPVVRAPLVYAEFAVIYAPAPPTSNSFYLRLQRLDYQATAAERVGDGIKDLVFSFQFETPGRADEKDSVKKLAAFTVDLLKTPVGSNWSAATLVDRVSAAQGLPGRTAADPTAVISLVGTLTETEKAGDIEAIITESIDAKKADLGKAIGDAILKALDVKKAEAAK